MTSVEGQKQLWDSPKRDQFRMLMDLTRPKAIIIILSISVLSLMIFGSIVGRTTKRALKAKIPANIVQMHQIDPRLQSNLIDPRLQSNLTQLLPFWPKYSPKVTALPTSDPTQEPSLKPSWPTCSPKVTALPTSDPTQEPSPKPSSWWEQPQRELEVCCIPPDIHRAQILRAKCEFNDPVSIGLFVEDMVNLKMNLPYVAILPLSSRFRVDNRIGLFWENMTYSFWADSTHGQDAKFIYWMNSSYNKVVPVAEAEYFFVPAFQKERPYEEWWADLDKDLRWIFDRPSVGGLDLDRTFMASTQVFSPNQLIEQQNRFSGDLRLLRVDNDFTGNGRDIYVPYVVHRGDWPFLPRNYTAPSLEKRNHFITAPCREAAGTLDWVRRWRTKVHDLWHNVPDSIITQELSNNEFIEAYLTSDFCLIIPGDTSSTSKFYKAIFAGCIPVIFISFFDQLPFTNLIDWSQFAVVVKKDAINYKPAMDELLAFLTDVRNRPETLAQYKLALSYAAYLFDYDKLDWPSVYHLTLLQLKSENRNCNLRVGNKKALSRYFCGTLKGNRRRHKPRFSSLSLSGRGQQ